MYALHLGKGVIREKFNLPFDLTNRHIQTIFWISLVKWLGYNGRAEWHFGVSTNRVYSIWDDAKVRRVFAPATCSEAPEATVDKNSLSTTVPPEP